MSDQIHREKYSGLFDRPRVGGKVPDQNAIKRQPNGIEGEGTEMHKQAVKVHGLHPQTGLKDG